MRNARSRIANAIAVTGALLLALRPAPAQTTVSGRAAKGGSATGTVTGSDWVLNTGIRLWFVDARSKFCHPWPTCGAFSARVSSPLGTKNVAGPITRVTPAIPDPDASGANGNGDATLTVTPGVLTLGFSYVLDANANAVPGHDVETEARLLDPVGLNVGSAGTSIFHDDTLHAGTQVQRSLGGPVLDPDLLIEARFGLGAYSDLPGTFWNDVAPGGVFDLYRIRVFENALHQVDAAVTFFGSPSPAFTVSYSTTASVLANAIRSAPWSSSPDAFTLGGDLPLVDVRITSNDPASFGAAATLGVRVTETSVAVTPEPSTLALAAFGLLALTIGRRRGRRAGGG